MNIKVYEVKNGDGYIKEYDFNGKLTFEGEYINCNITYMLNSSYVFQSL